MTREQAKNKAEYWGAKNCNEIIDKIYDDFEKEKICDSCKYDFSSYIEGNCKTCSRAYSDKWEPKQ